MLLLFSIGRYGADLDIFSLLGWFLYAEERQGAV